MSRAQDDVPEKVQIILECVGRRFYDVNLHNLQQDCFVFNDGKRSFQFGFYHPAMGELPLKELETFMETDVIPMIAQNPGMQTNSGADGLSVRDRVLN